MVFKTLDPPRFLRVSTITRTKGLKLDMNDYVYRMLYYAIRWDYRIITIHELRKFMQTVLAGREDVLNTAIMSLSGILFIDFYLIMCPMSPMHGENLRAGGLQVWPRSTYYFMDICGYF